MGVEGIKGKKVTVNLPKGGCSGKNIIAIVDPENKMVETDEMNNQTVYGPIP